MLKTYVYFHYFASALPRSVKIGIWQAALVAINLYAKYYQICPKGSRVLGIFDANCHILASVLPRSRKSDNVQFPIWTPSICMRVPNFIKISRMVEDL